MDLCTVVFEDEIETLKLQARSVDLYCSDVETIYVIVNDDIQLCNKIDLSTWGRYKDHVVILPRTAFGTTWSDNGWLSQQVLKLATASISQSTYCVALDAKTIFVNQLPQVVKDGKICVGTLPIAPVFEPSRQIVNRIWNIDLQQQLGPGGVPFWFSPKQVRSMISDIETRTNQSFIKWFQDQGMLTEFLLYSGWIEYQQGLDYVVSSCNITVQNLCHSEINLADQKIKNMPNSTTVSIHRRAWTELSPLQQKQYQDLLKQKLKI